MPGGTGHLDPLDEVGAVTTRLVMISGPIAAGKSTLAVELCRLLRLEGRSVALTTLDAVAEMALPTLPDWDWAHSIHAQLVGAWLATGIDLVVDEGTCNPSEVHQVLAQVSEDVQVFHVVLSADYRASLARAQGDPTRGISRDPAFLRADHDAYSRTLADLPCSLRLHVEGRTVQDLAQQVLDQLS